jgi:uncharacterized protein (TIGR02145 family)
MKKFLGVIGIIILSAILVLQFTMCKAGKGTVKGTMKDIEGNVYQIVTIGTQTWMAENLRTTKYRDGTPIPMITDNTSWEQDTNGACSSYNNEPAKTKIYGLLYNGYAIMNSKNLAPAGWHIPSDQEWNTLVDYLGGEKEAGGKLKGTANTYWYENVGATDESGFTALPGGYRDATGFFDWLGLRTFIASSTEWGPKAVWFRDLQNLNPWVNRAHFTENAGLSVRCIKD